jgi:hypothetical protein
MKLTYSITLKDFKAAIRLHSRQKLGRRIHFFIYDVIFPFLAILALLGTIGAYVLGHSEVVDVLIVPDAALLCIVVLVPILRAYRTRKSFKGMFPPSETGPGYSLDIDNERILSVRPGIGEAKYYWAGICAFAQDDKVMLMYITEILFICIPTHSLSPDQRAELDSLITRNIARKQK